MISRRTTPCRRLRRPYAIAHLLLFLLLAWGLPLYANAPPSKAEVSASALVPKPAQIDPSNAASQLIQPSLKGDSYSKSPLGYASLRHFLEDSGFAPTLIRDPRTHEFSKDDVILMLDPTLHHTMSPAQIQALDTYLSSEATLVVSLPKRYAAQQSLSGQDLLKTGMLSRGASAGILRLVDGYGNVQRQVLPETHGPWDARTDIENFQSFHDLPDSWEVLVGDANAAFVVRGVRRNGAPMILVSDADAWTNHAFARADHAWILARILQESLPSNGALYLDEAFHGYLQVYAPFQIALRERGLWLTIATLLFALLGLWYFLASPRRTWREFEVVPHQERALAERVGDILGAYRSPRDRVQKFRDLVVEAALPQHAVTSADASATRIAHLERLRPTSRSLQSLDAELAALAPNASRRHTQQLLRNYQQWFAEVSDATR